MSHKKLPCPSVNIGSVLLLFILANAASSSETICGKSNTHVDRVFLLENKSQYVGLCELIPIVFETLDEVARYYPHETQSKVTLMVYPEGPTINYSGSSIWLPTLFRKNLFRSLSSSEMKTIIAHEYGHHFFFRSLAKDYPEIRIYLDEMDKQHSLNVSYFGALKNKSPESEVNRLSNLRKKQSQHIESLIGHQKRNTILEPYSEFYADTVAILFSRDLKAIYQTQRSDTDLEREKLARYRDYSLQHSTQNWNVTEAYSLLAPTRSHIGKQLKNLQSMTSVQKSAFLEKLYLAIASEIRIRWNEQKLDPQKANESLIQALQ